jgi:menaquinol-cytochrome c reductase iron-sulfur subunit
MAEPTSPSGFSAQPGPEDPARRRFLSRVSFALSGLISALLGVPVLGYLLAPLLAPPRPEWVEIGPTNAFALGQMLLHKFSDTSPLPYAGLTSATAVWVRQEAANDFTVFAVNCTHLGCPVSWLPTASVFLCPCHGGAYYGDGSVAAGPPPQPLYEYETRVENGRLYVLTRPLPPSDPWSPPRLPGLRRRSEQG